MSPISPALSGSLAALGAFSLWGFMPVYFKLLAAVAPGEILSHRILWSSVLTLLLCLLARRWRALVGVFRSPRRLGLLTVSAALIAGNWLLFIWAVNNNRMVEASLGYYINPLVNLLLGYVFLQERLAPLQRVAAALAITGVAIKVLGFGQFPWVAMGLAMSFGLYGLLRKRMSVDSLLGLCVETTLLVPVGLAYLLISNSPTTHLPDNHWQLNLLFLLAGPATTLPLLLFVIASRRLTLSSLGFFQYLAPSCMFLLAIGVYGETVEADQWITFGFIWTALGLVSWHAVQTYRRPPPIGTVG